MRLTSQVATDALTAMEKAMARDKIQVNDRQLACARINSQEGQDYLAAMACAANVAWVNRSSMTFLVRQAFAKMFHTTPDDLDMHLVYDVSHNIAKVRQAHVSFIFHLHRCSVHLRSCQATMATLGKFRSAAVHECMPVLQQMLLTNHAGCPE